jgi:hypothetical protein
MGKNHFRRFREWSLNDPEVIAILTGIRRAARNLYVDQDEKRVAIFTKLKWLGMSTNSATTLLQEAQATGIIPFQPRLKPPPRTKIPKGHPKERRELTDPAISEVVASLYRDGLRYFQILPDGTARYCHPQRLLQLSHRVVARLLREANAAGLIQPRVFPGKVKLTPAPPIPSINDNEDEIDGSTSLAARGKKPKPRNHIYLVQTNNGWWGIWNSQTLEQRIISRDEALAQAELKRILRLEEKEPFLKRSRALNEIIYA